MKSALKAMMVSEELTSQDQTVRGRRAKVMPGQRRRRMVARKLTEESTAARQKRVMAMSQRSMPVAWPGPVAAMALKGG